MIQTFEEIKKLKPGDGPRCNWIIKSKNEKTPKYPVHVCHNAILSLTDQSSRLADENIESLTKPEIAILKKVLQNPDQRYHSILNSDWSTNQNRAFCFRADFLSSLIRDVKRAEYEAKAQYPKYQGLNDAECAKIFDDKPEVPKDEPYVFLDNINFIPGLGPAGKEE